MSNLAAVPNTSQQADAPAQSRRGGASPARLRAVIEAAPVALGLLDPDGTVRAWNQAAMQLLDVTQLTDVRGHRIDEFVAPDHAAALQGFIDRVCGGDAGSLQYQMLTPAGTRRWVETRAVPLAREGSDQSAFLGASWDITDQRAAAVAAEEGAAELARLREELSVLESARTQWVSQQGNLTAKEGEWAAERSEFERQVRALQEQTESLRAEMDSQREMHRQALDDKDRAHKAILAQRTEDAESAVTAMRSRYERSLTEVRNERDKLLTDIQEWEQRSVQAAGTQRAEREAFEERLRGLQDQAASVRKELEAERDRHRQTLDAERQKFEERLRATQEQATAVKDELEAERDHHRLAIDDIERAHEAVLAAQAKDAQSAARAAQARYEQNMAEAQAERDTLLGNVQEWEQRYTQALESRRVERDEFEDALETARRRNDQLREAQEDWRRELGRTLEGLTGVADRATALLTRGEGKPVVTARPRAATPLKVAAPTVAAPEADVEMDSVEITPWEF